MRSLRRFWVSAAALFVVLAGGTAIAGAFEDWGVDQQTQLENKSNPIFGVGQPLAQSSTVDLNQAQALAEPAGLITVAKGLDVRVVSAAKAPADIDQMVLWPQTNPQYLIACNEQGVNEPALVRISLASGDVANIVKSGLISCDPVRVTPWGSVIFGEEAGSTPASAMWEVVNPLAVTDATIDRAAGTSSSPNIGRVNAFGFLSFEGLAILPNGVTYYGDELAASGGSPGGAYYKFVPSTLWSSGGSPITSLSQSPFKSGTSTPAGTVFGLRVGTSSNYGQGFQYGTGSWRTLTSTPGQELRPLAATNKLTGYYRPEDIATDTAALARGEVRFCGNNTGRDSARYYGETICFTDGTVSGAASGSSTPQVQLLVQGSDELNMPDNIAFQASRGHWIIEEDGSTADNVAGPRNNDIWDCLDDGADNDILGDGCVRIATLNDYDAESTGGFFDSTGEHYYVSIQHNSSGYGTVLDITGWGSQGQGGK